MMPGPRYPATGATRFCYKFPYRRKEVVQKMHDKSGTPEVRGR
jgi:hypothetical protein